MVKARLRGKKPLSDPEAEAFVRGLVGALTEDAFVRTEVMQWETEVTVDIYGARDKHGDWYVKIYIVNDEVVVVPSCHEPEGTMWRADGVRVGRPRK